jgi:hypothetical protein
MGCGQQDHSILDDSGQTKLCSSDPGTTNHFYIYLCIQKHTGSGWLAAIAGLEMDVMGSSQMTQPPAMMGGMDNMESLLSMTCDGSKVGCDESFFSCLCIRLA